ncbi:MAG: hypothetical protein IJA38_02165 [Bacteroidales bacterium]|nr:hypothetical protein [Bacteroidales bacterium]MBP3343106.1 hypothetical protein [Bacteroidales bacterium]MBQ3521614.1 hypothetical protein [Bacteroidales bacterium]MBQ5803237.1 hypothetical protein [Bacteroidales bacterium]MBQ6871030.1 hypothetical protein [Bacteroidales bacterium]
MKRLFFALLLSLSVILTSCVENSSKYKALKAQLDSLNTEYGIQSSELDEVFATLNEVEAGLKSIRESENIIAVQSQTQDGMEVPAESKIQIKQDMEAVKQAIKKYQQQIAELKKDNRIQSQQFKKRLNALSKELKEKSELIENLTAQLDEKDAQLEIKTKEIASLGEVVSNLKNEVNTLSVEEKKLKDKVASQEQELYSVYYIVGSKSDLIDAGVITKGGLFKSAKVSYLSEQDTFVKIDYRNISIINTNAKRAKVLSIHPKGTYTLENDAESGEVSLIISDPAAFWEQTKYLVIQTN